MSRVRAASRAFSAAGPKTRNSCPNILDHMANDERQSEQFIREVDEELRRAQLKAIWDRFAPYIIGACVLIVVITAGYRGWVWWQEKKAAEAGDRFMAALSEIETGDKAKGEADLAAIAAQAGS